MEVDWRTMGDRRLTSFTLNWARRGCMLRHRIAAAVLGCDFLACAKCQCIQRVYVISVAMTDFLCKFSLQLLCNAHPGHLLGSLNGIRDVWMRFAWGNWCRREIWANRRLMTNASLVHHFSEIVLTTNAHFGIRRDEDESSGDCGHCLSILISFMEEITDSMESKAVHVNSFWVLTQWHSSQMTFPSKVFVV